MTGAIAGPRTARRSGLATDEPIRLIVIIPLITINRRAGHDEIGTRKAHRAVRVPGCQGDGPRALNPLRDWLAGQLLGDGQGKPAAVRDRRQRPSRPLRPRDTCALAVSASVLAGCESAKRAPGCRAGSRSRPQPNLSGSSAPRLSQSVIWPSQLPSGSDPLRFYSPPSTNSRRSVSISLHFRDRSIEHARIRRLTSSKR